MGESNTILVLFFCILEFGVFALVGLMAFHIRRLRSERYALRQEREVIMGFVRDMGALFSDEEEPDLTTMLERALFYAVQTTCASAGAIYLTDSTGDFLSARAVSGVMPPVNPPVNKSATQNLTRMQHVTQFIRSQQIPVGEGLLGEAAAFARSFIIEDASVDDRVPTYETDFLSINSLLIVPMRFHTEALGVVALVNPENREAFGVSDLKLLQALADQAAVSIHYAGQHEVLEQKQRMDHDLTTARDIQNQLLPKHLPHIPGVDVAAFNIPAQEIGGDYYDFIEVDEDHLGVAIADVSGKGIPGGMMMTVCRSILRAYAPGRTSPAEVLKMLNRMVVVDISEDMFISVLYMVLNRKTRCLTVARAGHERPLLSHGDDSDIELIDSPGMAVGMVDADTFDEILQEKTVQLQVGDAVIIYTDGITEAMNRAGEEWGLENLLKAVRVAESTGAQRILGDVEERIFRFVGECPQYDDMTLLALQVNS